MFNHTSVEVLPLRGIGEYGCCSQERTINRFDPWPPHQLSCYKGFDEVTGRKFSSIQRSSQKFVLVQFKFLQSGVHEPMVQHVRLFVVMGGKNNVVDDVFECLRSPDQGNSINRFYAEGTYRAVFTLVIFYRRRVPHFLVVLRDLQVRRLM